MPQQILQSSRRRNMPWILAGLLLVVLGTVFAYLAYRERESALTRERDILLANARVVEENLSQQLLGASSALSSIRADLPVLVEQGEYVELSERLKAITDAQPGVRTMLAIDASGKVIGSSRTELIGLQLGDRPYFQQARARPDRETLYVSAPFSPAPGLFSLNLVKVWLDDQDRFAGVVTATLDPGFFEVLLRSVLSVEGTRGTLVHGSGQIFMSRPEAGMARPSGSGAVCPFFIAHRDSGRTENFFTGISSASGDERLLALRTTQPAALHMDMPLVVTLSRPVAAVLAPWRNLATMYAITYLLLAATVLGATHMVQRRRLALLQVQAARERDTREHAERLDMALAGGDLGLWDMDLEAGSRTVDARAQAMVGDAPGSAVDSLAQWAERVHPDDRAGWLETRREHEAGRIASMVVDYRVRHRDGHWVWIHSRGRVTQRDAQGRPLRVLGTYLDVSERKAAEAQLRHSAELLARMSRVSRTGGWDYDLRTRRSTWSPEMFRIREIDASVEPPQDSILNAYLPESRAQLDAARIAAIEYHTPWDMELQMTTARGNVIWVRSQGEAVVENGVTVALTGTLKNVTWRKQSQIDLKAANEKLERMALSDGLTGIANRRLFDQTLHSEWLRCARAGEPLALLMVDIDHFKAYNDHYGHGGGDECLRRVAQALAGCSRRAGELVCRYGGEEFAILLPGADMASARTVAQACQDAVRVEAIPHAQSSTGSWLSLSVGVASVRADAARTAHMLVERADAALYRAKRRGRARLETADDATRGVEA